MKIQCSVTRRQFRHILFMGAIGKWLCELNLQTDLDVEYFNLWRSSEDLAIRHITEYVHSETDEGAMVRTIIEHLPDGSDLFVSSNMPIRDIDTFLLPTSRGYSNFCESWSEWNRWCNVDSNWF
ncbi:hypothetical protein UACE39S_04475 [Ureibacillus acetophenoni]